MAPGVLRLLTTSLADAEPGRPSATGRTQERRMTVPTWTSVPESRRRNPPDRSLVSRGMHDLRVGRRFTVAILSLLLVVAACGSAATPSTPATPPADAPVTAPPDDGSTPDPGTGGGDLDGIKDVVPRPGQLDVRDISAETLLAEAGSGSITVTAVWWSGVEPCNVLDTVLVTAEGGGWSITLREGRGPEDVACIAIAEQHRTTFEIPDVAPGTYTIRDATGGAPPVEVTVP
jgi:hypothetical protein